MSASSAYAILLDGGFVIKKLQQRNRHFPKVEDISAICTEVGARPEFDGYDLLRNYFYHARPAKDVIHNPLDRAKLDLGATPIYRQHLSLLDRLELLPYFSVRLGETMVHEWRLGSSAMRDLSRSPREIRPADLVPNITQKGVDLRIGLDIARLALREVVQAIVVVTGDSDLVPAFKFARREGLKIFLHTLRHGVRRDLKAHADVVL